MEKPIRPEGMDKDLGARLNRIEGQVRGVKAMIERGAYCDDIMTQIASVQSAMNSVSKILLASHIETCVAPRLENGDSGAIDELVKTIGRLL